MPLKLPAPDDGTAEQAGPNGFEAAWADWDGIAEEAGAEEAGFELADEPLEPQAATPNAALADSAATAANLYFIGILLC